MNRPKHPSDPIRVMLVDDHELVRSGLRALLSLVDGVDVVAEARHGAELLQLMATHEVDIVMCDLTMPGMDGLDVMEQIRRQYPGVDTIIVSMDNQPESIRRALAQGAAGYIVKQAASVELALALRTVAAGGRYVSPTIARVLLQPPPADAPEGLLTPRQMEILTLIAHGRTAREIGERLGLSSKTVDVHRARIMERLGLHDIAGLTRYALKYRLVR
jgi:DNA-binding NarL/FixJ family response regulator